MMFYHLLRYDVTVFFYESEKLENIHGYNDVRKYFHYKDIALTDRKLFV